ncbi:MAG: toll/interleukin-1 receptor domain-containing protein [Firmicutes bacterium]|nr:toll/interleukin-1 receptor domain-containing protein [Bacillota bacterium]
MAENFDVFISYRRSDGTALAVNVRDGLEKRGFRVFLDERDLEGGEDFDEQLEKNIIAAPNYILIATPDVFKFREKKRLGTQGN